MQKNILSDFNPGLFHSKAVVILLYETSLNFYPWWLWCQLNLSITQNFIYTNMVEAGSHVGVETKWYNDYITLK